MIPDRPSGTAPPQVAGDTQQLAARIGAKSLSLRLVAASDVTRSVRRLRFESDELRTINYSAGQDFTFRIGPSSPVRRRYTIRALDRDKAAVDIDVVLHGDGPGAQWAAAARLGEWVEAIGPRGKVVAADGAAWHLFIGDESFTPAALAIAQSLREQQPAVLLLEVDGPDDHLPAAETVSAGALRWVHRDGPGESALVDTARSVTLPPGTGHAYVGGETRSVAAVKAALLERGFAPHDISAKAYWQAGLANADHGEPSKR